MEQVKAKLTEGGRITIPPEYCEALGLQAGDDVILRLEDGALRILALGPAIRRAQEIVRDYFPAERSLVDELIEERRAEVGL